MIYVHTVDRAVRTRKINILKDASCLFLLRNSHAHIRCDSVLCDGHDLARLYIPDELGIHRCDRTALGCEEIRIVPFSDTQRLQSERISRADHLPGAVDNKGIGASDLFHGVLHRFFGRSRIQTFSGDMICDHLRINRRLEDRARILQFSSQLDSIDKIPVVGNGQCSLSHN